MNARVFAVVLGTITGALSAYLVFGTGYSAADCRAACAPRQVGMCRREEASCVEPDHVLNDDRLMVLHCWEACNGSPQMMVVGTGAVAHCECGGIPTNGNHSQLRRYGGVAK
jgi:hypothetical protein